MKSFLAKLFAGSLLCFTAMALDFDHPSRASIRHIEAGGIGYNQGYTTFEGFFAPDPAASTVMPFLDLRAHVFNDGKFAANIGGGIRAIAGCRVYGLNAYYDYRNTKRIHDINQGGFGFETLGQRLDFRINGYLPVGKKISSPLKTQFAGFSGHHLMLLQKYNFAMKGFNAELGCHFGKSRLFDFYAAAGTYYFTGKNGPHVWGGKGRLLAKYKEYVTIELSDSYDKMFRNRFQGQLTLTLPFGGGVHTEQTDSDNSCRASNVLLSRMVQPVERQEIIVVGCKNKTAVAIDPATGRPFNVVFVDNTSNSQGTFKSPYPTLALAQANSSIGDIIYVFPGDGTTKGMDAGITLQLNQKFWGSGVGHALQTAQGNIIIPALSSSAPKMTNLTGDGITLAAVNQVSGFIITNAANYGIVGMNAGNIEISECVIDHSLIDQIHLEYSGPSGCAALENLTITNGGENAIFIDSTNSSLACNVNNCIMKNNNSISRAPILITAGTDPVSVTITNNTISDNVCGAIHFVPNNTELAQLTVSNNTITNNGTGSIASNGSAIFMDPNGSSLGNCNVQLTNNVISDNAGGCLYCSNGWFNDFQVNATGNTITGNGGGGLTFDNNYNTLTLAATNNTISHGQDHGISTSDRTITTATMTISNNQITDNSNFANAIALSHAGNDLNLVVTNNDLSRNDTSGIILYSGSEIVNVAVNIANNTINGNQNTGFNVAGGIDLEQYNNLSGSITNNILANVTAPDVYIGSIISPSVCLQMTGNSSTMGYELSSGGGTFNLAPCDVNAVNVGTITTVGVVNIVQSCPEAIICP